MAMCAALLNSSKYLCRASCSHSFVDIRKLKLRKHTCPPQPLQSCMLDRRFALCYLITSLWQTSCNCAANATPSHNRASCDCGLYLFKIGLTTRNQPQAQQLRCSLRGCTWRRGQEVGKISAFVTSSLSIVPCSIGHPTPTQPSIPPGSVN